MAYGIEVYDASGNPTLTISDRVGFFIARLTGFLAANSSTTVSVANINSTTTKAIVDAEGWEDEAPIKAEVGTNQVVITNSSNTGENYIVLLVRFS